ncbi:MAG: type II toxin-antitoxin system VapC family toxin [Rectinemataceae bacterium]
MARGTRIRGVEVGSKPEVAAYGTDMPPNSSILVDSSPLVYLIEGSAARRRAVEDFLGYASGRGCRLIASTIVWTELLRKPLGSGDATLADLYRTLLADSAHIVLVPVDVAVAEEAARLLARRPLEFADAIHLATARVEKVSAVLGNDAAWRRIPECPRLFLVDELAFER